MKPVISDTQNVAYIYQRSPRFSHARTAFHLIDAEIEKLSRPVNVSFYEGKNALKIMLAKKAKQT